MTFEDYDQAYRLWSQSEGLCLGDDDSRDRIQVYLRRNAGLCFVAVSEGKLVGTVLCGHDGRRGVLRHLAVLQGHRGKGVARALIKAGLTGLGRSNIRKCNLYVEDYNPDGLRFWEHLGWYHVKYDYRTLQIQIAEPGAAPNGGLAPPSGSSGVAERPPSVS